MTKWISLIISLLIAVLLLSGCGSNGELNGNGGGSVKTFQPSGTSVDTSQPAQDTAAPSVTETSAVQTQETEAPPPARDPIKDQIDGMTLDEKIGQMVMSGVDGYTISDTTLKLINDYHVGGFIILGGNVKDANQLLQLVNSLKTANSSSIPMFLSVDQEGGRVDRMPPEIKRLPTNEAVGGVNNSGFSYKLGGIIADELNAFGFNMDFAPVLDINSNPKNPVIGDRSFGANPDIVTKLGIQTMKGIESGNIISVVKHFPGHGDTSVDSHVGLPLVNNDMERLKSFELIPFGQAIDENVDAVMVAHILLPKIDPKYPSSMSKKIITDTLRGDLSFGGVVITDDMTMGAITKNYNIGDAAVTSVNAGSDIVLVCHGYDEEVSVIDALKKAVQDGTISEERIDQSVYRILKLKQKYGISDKTVKSIDTAGLNSKISKLLSTYMK